MKLKKYNENYAVLFHHFHDKKLFYKSPGSLEKKKFSQFVKFNKKKISSSKNFLENFDKKKKLISLSFDDGLKCQYNLALPVLEKAKIKAFFFIPTSIFNNKKLSFEVIRYLKYKYFSDVNKFYKIFIDHINKNQKLKKKIKKNTNKLFNKIKTESPYYTKLDIEHKIIRDYLITENDYNKVILSIIKKKKINIKKIHKKLFMSKKNISKLFKLGHTIGLHSHSHNFQFHKLNYNQELREYKKNKLLLENILQSKVNVASYPFGYQTENSSKIFQKVGINFAFNKNFKKRSKNINKKNFNMSRENISNIIKI